MGRPTKFDGMMHDVCVGLGFCGDVIDGTLRHIVDYIPESGSVSADQFSSWVLAAEGMPSEVGDPFWSEIRAVFVRHMNAEIIDAETLRGQIYK